VLVDSHCHLNYLDDPDAKLAAARRVGVAEFLCIGVNASTHSAVMAIANRHDDVWASAGVHPESADAEASLNWVAAAAQLDKVVGIGETGLDYFKIEGDVEAVRRSQRDSFAAHLGIARDAGLPVIVHTRSAEADTLDLLRAHPGSIGVLHCFTESWALARGALELGWYISISGIVTFRNADNVRDVARRVPVDRLLVETDAPWLAPVPHRGKPNEPAFVTHTAAAVAALRGEELSQLAARTTENFRRLFGRATPHERGNSSS
jgi:TatD DNase family protein